MLGSQALETPQLDFRELNEPHLAWLLQPSPEPVEPDLALHQGFLEPSQEYSAEPFGTWPGSAPKPPRPLRNLLQNPVEPDLLCTEASRNLVRNLALHQSLPGLLRNLLRNQGLPDLLRNPGCAPKPQAFSGTHWNWLGFALRLPGTFFGTFSGTLSVEPDLALHQSLPDLEDANIIGYNYWVHFKPPTIRM